MFEKFFFCKKLRQVLLPYIQKSIILKHKQKTLLQNIAREIPDIKANLTRYTLQYTIGQAVYAARGHMEKDKLYILLIL